MPYRQRRADCSIAPRQPPPSLPSPSSPPPGLLDSPHFHSPRSLARARGLALRRRCLSVGMVRPGGAPWWVAPAVDAPSCTTRAHGSLALSLASPDLHRGCVIVCVLHLEEMVRARGVARKGKMDEREFPTDGQRNISSTLFCGNTTTASG